MPRPPIERNVSGVPSVTLFKPAGVPVRDLQQLQLGVDELEAIRLVDLEGLSHEQAAEVMGVSRQTVGRVLERARARVAEALVHGKAILISGGQYRVQPPRMRCFVCQARWTDAGEKQATVCPQCGAVDIGMCWGPGERCGRGRGHRSEGEGAAPTGPGRHGGRGGPGSGGCGGGGRGGGRGGDGQGAGGRQGASGHRRGAGRGGRC